MHVILVHALRIGIIFCSGRLNYENRHFVTWATIILALFTIQVPRSLTKITPEQLRKMSITEQLEEKNETPKLSLSEPPWK